MRGRVDYPDPIKDDYYDIYCFKEMAAEQYLTMSTLRRFVSDASNTAKNSINHLDTVYKDGGYKLEWMRPTLKSKFKKSDLPESPKGLDLINLTLYDIYKSDYYDLLNNGSHDWPSSRQYTMSEDTSLEDEMLRTVHKIKLGPGIYIFDPENKIQPDYPSLYGMGCLRFVTRSRTFYPGHIALHPQLVKHRDIDVTVLKRVLYKWGLKYEFDRYQNEEWSKWPDKLSDTIDLGKYVSGFLANPNLTELLVSRFHNEYQQEFNESIFDRRGHSNVNLNYYDYVKLSHYNPDYKVPTEYNFSLVTHEEMSKQLDDRNIRPIVTWPMGSILMGTEHHYNSTGEEIMYIDKNITFYDKDLNKKLFNVLNSTWYDTALDMKTNIKHISDLYRKNNVGINHDALLSSLDEWIEDYTKKQKEWT
mgnify:CR=1 FL=1